MGNGVPNTESHVIFEPTTGDLLFRLTLASHFDLTRTEHNDIRIAAINAGGMSNVSAAYAAVKTAMNSLASWRGAWLDHYTTGQSSGETDQIRRAVVWHFVARDPIPSPPSP